MNDPNATSPGVSMKCRMCAGNQIAPLHHFGALPVAGYLVESRKRALAAERFEGRLVLCTTCGLVQQAGESFRDVLVNRVYANYRPTYSMSTEVREYMTRFLSEAVSFTGGIRSADVVLEIGSNDGSMFDLLRSKGFRPAGIDPSAPQAQHPSDIVIRDFFSQEVARQFVDKHGTVELAFSRHTLEHVFDPVDFMRAMNVVLAERGVCVIEVPYLPIQLSGNQFGAMTFQHISFFTYQSLAQLAQLSGLRILRAIPSRMDGGAIIIFLGKSSRRGGPTAGATEGFLQLELLTGSGAHPVLLNRFTDISTAIVQLKDHIVSLRRDAVDVVAYGAGAKGQAMLNMAALGSELIPFVVDDTPGSAGMFIPGVGTEVITSGDSRLGEADVVLITAPTHAAVIVAKEGKRYPKLSFIHTSPQVGYVSSF